MLTKGKKGISLVVLIMTIIIMIILATIMVLTLTNNNASDKAEGAKSASDLASKKEAAGVYLSDYKAEVARGKIDERKISANDYIMKKLKNAGFDTSDVYVTEDEEILIGIAALFAKNSISLGTEVTGYELDADKVEYETSGNENTAVIPSGSASGTEGSPQPKTITRDNKIKWIYIGMDENNNVLLAGSVTSDSPKMSIGGKGGVVYGPQELNNACEFMYSSKMGVARSINMDDVLRVLEYTGEKRGSYYDKNGQHLVIYREMTIGELANSKGYSMIHNKGTPEEGTSIETYKANEYTIDARKEEEFSQMNADRVKLIIPGSASQNPNLIHNYWLADSCVQVDFRLGLARFMMRYVVKATPSGYIGSINSWYSSNSSFSNLVAVRPVVVLNPELQMTYDGTTVMLQQPLK